MKIKQLKLLMVTSLFGSTLAFAQAGSHGGDTCEEKFQDISRNLRSFVQAGGGSQIVLPAGETSFSFQSKMLEKLGPYLDKSPNSEISFQCTSDPVFAQGSEKTCVWRDPNEDLTIEDGKIHIDCNFNRFLYGVAGIVGQGANPQMNLEPFQYKQVIHEWASIAGLETNVGATSDYNITDQVTSTGGFVPKFQLGIKVVVSPSAGVHFDHIQVNPDNSATITGISISRGDQTFPIDSSTGFSVLCRALGYDDSLEGPDFNTALDTVWTNGGATIKIDKSPITIVLDKNGNFLKYVSTDFSQSVTKVTCFSKRTITSIIEFQKVKTNLDGSTVINQILVRRGPGQFAIDSSTGIYEACRVLGYEKGLDGPGFNVSNATGLITVELDENRNFQWYIKAAFSKSLVKLTCISSTEPLVILVGGNVYRVIRPLP